HKSHSGNFTQGQKGATYSIVVTADAIGGPTDGSPVTVTDILPAGLTATAISGGRGWACTLHTLTRSSSFVVIPFPYDTIYGVIPVTVDVAPNAPASVTNIATVGGGGSSGSRATDPTTIITTALPDLTITKTHTGKFSQ